MILRDMLDRGPMADPHQAGTSNRAQYGYPVSPRELEVLHALSLGYDQKGAAAQLGISYQTIKNHLLDVRAKIGAATTIRAVVLYVLGSQLKETP